jgi:hypothetical protein
VVVGTLREPAGGFLAFGFDPSSFLVVVEGVGEEVPASGGGGGGEAGPGPPLFFFVAWRAGRRTRARPAALPRAPALLHALVLAPRPRI